VLRPRLLALALAVLATSCASLARADDAAPPPAPPATVAIAPSGGGAARTLALADLAAQRDVHDATYTLRAADGATSSVTVADGISLTALLAAAGLDADAFTYLEVARPDGTSALVLRDDLGGGEEGPPVVWADAAGVHLLRPSSGGDDANADDLVTFADGSLSLQLRTGDPVQPRIAVSKLRAGPNERIDFSASLAAGTLGAGMEFQWYFDGSGTVFGANVSHRFPRPGTYVVLLNVVRRSGESLGLPDQVRIRVVRPQRDERSGGARGSGESQGGRDGSGGAGSGDGAGGSDAAGGSGAGGSGTGDAAAPAFAPVAPPPAHAPPAAVAPTPRPHPDPAPRAARGTLVSGTLIAAAGVAAAPAGGVQAARAARGAAADGPFHVPVGAWVALGLVLLLALGWALESRHTLPFWQP
jgi:hypothetical protein